MNGIGRDYSFSAGKMESGLVITGNISARIFRQRCRQNRIIFLEMQFINNNVQLAFTRLQVI
jgi:hypothetical protein